MNTIIMITVVAGNIIGSATFDTIEQCNEARNKVIQQEGSKVYCTYQEKAPDHSKEFFQIFGKMLQEMGKVK